MNFTTPPQQQHSLPNEQWTDSIIPSNHITMPAQYQQSCTINGMQPIPIQQHQQPINNK